jgi:hypothetical protein
MTVSWVVAIELSIIILTLKRNELRYVLSFFIGWKLITKGILRPNTIFPFTAHPCKYNTSTEYMPTPRKPTPELFCKFNSTGSRNKKIGCPPDRIVVPKS